MSTMFQDQPNIDVSSGVGVDENISNTMLVNGSERERESDVEMEEYADGILKDDGSVDDVQTYPADVYSFITLHSPFDKNGFFYFGLFVWAFQIVFLMLIILRVMTKRSTNEDTDNPVEGIFDFIPANNNNLSKTTQFLALIAYCVFADESLKDIVTAVETFPKFSKAKPEDKTIRMVMSCVLRCVQGTMATFVVLLLVISTTDVIDLVLNFAAVNFISAFDDVAFELAQTGKYGPRLEAEANRIEELPVPPCLYQKYCHVRYKFTVWVVSFVLLSGLIFVTAFQFSKARWVTEVLRVQFKDDPMHEKYNGCYVVSKQEGVNRVWEKYILYDSFPTNKAQGRFGYCPVDRKWYLYTGNKTDPCDLENEEKVVFSARTYTFDIAAVQEEPWYSRTGIPLEWYFFDDNRVDLTDDVCDSFLGDGKCDNFFNQFDYAYDEGDCCGYTCSGLNCGRGTLTEAFNTNVSSGNGFPRCKDPVMVPITIEIHNVYVPEPSAFAPEDNSPLADEDALEPLLILDCDGQNYLMVNVKPDMKFQTETIMVSDGADCEITIKNVTGGPIDINYVNYSIYHGDKESVDSDPILMLNEDSQLNSMRRFRRIPDCYFTKLSKYINTTTIYTNNDPSNKAIEWLVEDSTDYSNCLDKHFDERYALAAINYALPNVVNETEENLSDDMALWIEFERQCAWKNVACVDGSVKELDLEAASGVYLTGTIPTEIGILENLARIDLGYNEIKGTIPTEIGEWNKLVDLGIPGAALTGTIPTEIGRLTNMEWIWLNENQLTGSIPTEIGGMTSLSGLFLYQNMLDGTIPSEIKEATDLLYFVTSINFLDGPLPSELGSLKNLIYLASSNALHTGTIPSELGELTKLDNFEMGNNALEGSVPVGLLNNTYINFDIYGNSLEGLVAIDGYEICDAGGGEVYCNCGSDCYAKKFQCGCEEAESCCAEFLEDRTPCIICPPSLKLKNPDFFVEYFQVTCQGAFEYVLTEIAEYGTKESCDIAKLTFPGIGCFCDDGTQPEDSGKDSATEVMADSVDV
eukprot:CAMPEP_0197181708 /NCGR_PEP_ID=MMETSP1423-20130617/5909_1 /TAXON_ID=476441 /ORGANISM="Pseudo-nitzschia heimii, Strain UNC1101" /LENGTH=1031 /DNA_ID=CAMNT_0042632005 /DNA_START=209 /DNA_END=3304 /DNA_ORIENTATION=-